VFALNRQSRVASCFAALLFTLLTTLPAFAKQQITIKNLSAKTGRYNDAAALILKYDVTLQNSLNELEGVGDTIDWYTISIFFEDNGQVMTSQGFAKVGDSLGRLTFEDRLIPFSKGKVYAGQQARLPLAAFALDEGAHCLHVSFTVRDNRGKEVACNFKSDSFDIMIPRRIKLKLAVSSILVSDTDFHGETWDAYLFNYNSSKPEVFWTTVLMGERLNFSNYTKNSFTYSDPDGLDDFEFSICKGDIFYIKVYDFDILSRNDFIGGLKVDMATFKDTGIEHKTKFDLVLNMDYTLATR